MRDINSTRSFVNDSKQKQPGENDRTEGFLSELISSLPGEERHRYSELLSDSLSLTETYQPPDIIESTGGMLQRAENDFLKSNFWQSLRIRFFALFNDASHSSSYINRKLFSIAHTANKQRRMFNVRTASLTSGFLFPFAQLYNTLMPLLEIYQKHWVNVDSIHTMLCEYLKHVLPPNIYRLSTYLSEEKKAEITKSGVDKISVFHYLHDQISLHFQKLSPQLLQKIEGDLFLLYIFRFVCKFDFQKIFSLFGVENFQGLLFSRRPSISFLQCRSLLFQFFYSLSELYRLPRNFDISEALLHVLSQHSVSTVSPQIIKKVMLDSRVLAEKMFSEKIITATLQCAYHDPYYHPRFIHNIWNIRDFIFIDTLMRICYQYNSISWGIHTKSSTKNIEQFFPNGLPEFKYIPANPYIAAADLELPPLMYTVELQIIQGFISEIFIGKILPWISSMHMNTNIKFKELVNTFMVQKNNCELVRSNIEQFDSLFSLSEAIGKKFANISLDLSNNLSNNLRAEQARIEYIEYMRSINHSLYTLLMRGKRMLREVSEFLGKYSNALSASMTGIEALRNGSTHTNNNGQGTKDNTKQEILARCDDYISVVRAIRDMITQISEANQETALQLSNHNNRAANKQEHAQDRSA